MGRGKQGYEVRVNGWLVTLTSREIEVLELAVIGLSNERIGQHLGISHRTVETYLSGLCAKLQADNRTHLAAQAVWLGLIKEPPIFPTEKP